jgi:putative membrane protein
LFKELTTIKSITMKKLRIALIATATALTLMSCHSKKDSTATADSLNKAADPSKTDTSKMTMPVTVDQDDAKFAVEAANGGMAEVMIGKLAQDKGGAQVKDFAAMMVKDHSMANDELMTLAKSKNIALPTVLDKDMQKGFDDLSKKTGADFDKAYVKLMVDDHKTDVKEFDKASQKVKDPDLKAFAGKTLPVLKMHLAAITKIDSTMKKK